MIPPLLVVGIVIGAFARHRRSMKAAIVITAAASLWWGAMVGVTSGSPSVIAAGSALGLFNVLAGAALSAPISALLRVDTRSISTTQR